MIKWIKKLFEIVQHYTSDYNNTHARIAALEKIVRDRTEVAYDVGYHGGNFVIVVGRYKNNDYVQTFQVGAEDFNEVIGHMRECSRYGRVTHIDAPPAFRAVFEREKKGYDFS